MVSRRILLVILLFCSCISLAAQEITGTIVGTVKDQGGAGVPKATVTFLNTDTNVVVRTVKTDEHGDYTVPLLPIGHYTISAEATGFSKTIVKNLELNVNSKLTQNLSLPVSGSVETVNIAADAQQVELQSATASGLISGTQIRELSLNNRNYEQLLTLVPGVSSGVGDSLYIGTTNPNGQTNAVSFSVNGQRNSTNNWTVDGADNVDHGSNITLLNYPSVDSIAEFKILRGQYNAEFGRSSSGQVNVVTKSGGSSYHGNAYEFFRNDKLNANDWFNNHNGIKRPALRYNDFGYTFGGPVMIPGHYNQDKKKTFFFFSQEFRRIITHSTFSATIPTLAERGGVFTAPVCADVRASGAVAFSAACTTVLPAGTPLAAINPVAARYIAALYKNVPDPQNLSTHNLTTTPGATFNHRQEVLKLDHNLNDKWSASFRLLNDTIPTTEPGGLFTNAAVPNVSTTSTESPGRNYAARVTGAINPSLFVEGGYSYSYGAIISRITGNIGTANSPNVNAPLVFPTTLGRVPTVTMTGLTSLTSFGPYDDFDRDHNVFANVTKIWNSHSFKFGVSYHHYQKNENAGGNNSGTFAFGTVGSPGAASNFSQAIANFLLGNVTTFSQLSRDATPDMQANQMEFYGQDEWRLRRNVTVTLGLRYSWFQQPVDANSQLDNFDPSLYVAAKAPAISLTTGLITSAAGTYDPLNGISVNNSTSPYGAQVGSSNLANFAPRIGVAWDPWGDGKTSVRAGYGIFYDSSLFGIYEQSIFNNPPFVDNLSYSSTRLENPGIVAANGVPPRGIRGTPTANKTPYVNQWSLDLQHEFPGGWNLDVGYYGSKGTHLIGIIDINMPLPAAYTTTPGIGVPAGTFVTAANTPALNAIRPYKGYSAINTIQPIFDSNYNSLQSQISRRFRGNSQISVAYTWSKGMTDAQSDRSSAAQNSYDLRSEYGPSVLDRRQMLTANYVYELPFYKDQRTWKGYAFGGWEISGIATFNSGAPLTVTSAVNADPAGQGLLSGGNSAASVRPDMIGDPNSGGARSIDQWFNTAVFVSVPAGQFRPGNEKRGTVIGPGYERFDLSLFKNIPIGERFKLQFRTETFNFLNHFNPNNPATSFIPGSTSFGKITSARDPRTLQFGLKLAF